MVIAVLFTLRRFHRPENQTESVTAAAHKTIQMRNERE